MAGIQKYKGRKHNKSTWPIILYRCKRKKKKSYYGLRKIFEGEEEDRSNRRSSVEEEKMANQGTDLFDAYFRRADLDGDGQISGAEAVAFFQASNLPKNVLAQVWMHADQRKLGFLGRAEFYNALKLVTVAQSKRELTPDIVKAALYGPASSRIPPPQINLAAAPSPAPPQPRAVVGQPAQQNVGIRPQQGQGQFFPSQQNQFTRPPQGMPPSNTPLPQQNQVPGGASFMATPRPPTAANATTDWLSASSQSPNRGVAPPSIQDGFALTASGLTPSVQPRPSATTTPATAPKPQDPFVIASQAGSQDSKALVVSGNGFPSDSLFGDVFSATSAQPKPSIPAATSPAGSLPVSTAIVPATSGSQASTKPTPLESSQNTFSQKLGALYQQGQQTGNQTQRVAAPSSTALMPTGLPVVAGNLASNQPPSPAHPWPKMTQSDIQKYNKVFVQVDTDRDGKITGEQARNLFLSWRLPREVLKRVWDLSDQDNDSMLSSREFCTALYLMERFREGRPLPATLPGNIFPDQTLPPAPHQSTAPHGRGTWAPTYGTQQLPPQVATGARPVSHAAARKPPRPQGPLPVSHTDAPAPPTQQKPKVPVLEKHLVDQLSKEEQDSLNSRFQDATTADKKVEELEKEIVTAREKIQFYHTKMQELILYKSRCDNRLNEITERVSGDKREVELLAKKYEEKYKQSGDVASKLTLEEATFRDIQEKKMELYQAIVKMDQGDTTDGALKERVDLIQSGLEELVKSLNERCKQYGLRAKPTTLLELPFGWQPGIQEGAADWDENWDKFDDEGYTIVKELTLDVENVIAPPKTKSSPTSKETSAPKDDATKEKSSNTDERNPENESATDQSKDGLVKTPPESPAGRSPAGRDAGESHSPQFGGVTFDGSPHSKDSKSGAGSLFSGDRGFDEPSWGTFDTSYDTDSVAGFDTASAKGNEGLLFDPEDFPLKPIRTEIPRAENAFQGKTPAYRSSVFADSVPSTPAYNFGYSPPKFSGGAENKSFDSFSRFDSFNMSESGFAQSPRNSLSRFDSFRSTADSDANYGLPSLDSLNPHDSGFFQTSQSSLARFDSVRTPRESDQNYGFNSQSRFDSLQTPRDSDNGRGFDSFSRFDSLQTPRESDNSRGFDSFSRFDSLQTPRESDNSRGFDSFSRFDSFRSTTNETNHGNRFGSFDDSDPFGSTGPFRTSFDSQTPRGTDNWNTPSFDSQTPRKSTDDWNPPSFDSQTPRKGVDDWHSSFDSQTPKKGTDNWNAF
ncbi:uncharacterized protein [Rutidosis leptorrhynchoides]|uniref:uncharacterized protein n=1 Tax=Rutidosis leptorrhynchoides TaxID=125765 RepID=UPI003A98FD37